MNGRSKTRWKTYARPTVMPMTSGITKAGGWKTQARHEDVFEGVDEHRVDQVEAVSDGPHEDQRLP